MPIDYRRERDVNSISDDVVLDLGNGSDAALVLRSTALAADAELSNVIVGTSDHPGVAANSLIIANQTADGDIMLATQSGGNTTMSALMDASAGDFVLQGLDLVFGGSTASIDYTGNLYFTGTLATASNTNNYQVRFNEVDSSVTATASNTGTGTSGYAFVEIDAETIAAASSYTFTEASTLMIGGPPAAGTNMTLTNPYAMHVVAGTSRFGGHVLIGGQAAQDFGTTGPGLQLLGTGSSDGAFGMATFRTNSGGPVLYAVKSKNATIGLHTIVADEDNVFTIEANPDDGVDYATAAARYIMQVDDPNPEAGGVGMAHVWSQQLAGSTNALRETMRLSTTGSLMIGDDSVANEHQAIGLTINQAANDDTILAFKSSDINH